MGRLPRPQARACHRSPLRQARGPAAEATRQKSERRVVKLWVLLSLEDGPTVHSAYSWGSSHPSHVLSVCVGSILANAGLVFGLTQETARKYGKRERTQSISKGKALCRQSDPETASVLGTEIAWA